MFIENIFQITLILATFFTSLVAGFLFAFAIVVMPGIKILQDQEFIRAFQVIDGIIQKNNPLFIIVWAGSVLTLIVSAIFGLWQLDGIARITLLLATSVYIVGVQLPTITINVPLNNVLQNQDLDSMDAQGISEARKNFEPKWLLWNTIRTIFAILTSMLLLVLLLKI